MADIPIKFRHLKTFIEVARQKSVGKAAQVLHVSQPAVTKTIRELEEALNAQLFEKDGRGIRITRYGDVFLQHAGASVAAIQRGIDSVARAQSSSGPPLRVGALPTVSARIMPRAIELFLAERTGSPIKIVTGENVVLLEQLRLGQLDLVVGRLAAPEQMQGLNFSHLYTEQVMFVVRKGHPLLKAPHFDFERIREFTVLMPTQGSIIRPFAERFLISHGIAEIPNEVETVSDSFGRAMLRQSDAVWIISGGVVSTEIEGGEFEVLPIDTTETRGSVGFTTRRDTDDPASVEILTRTIRETVRTLGL
ncbi:MAG: pca operon transcription factor PcaQ [Devosia sp.]|nr:pca operon transcription factor PcaQ [Devosia sp.]